MNETILRVIDEARKHGGEIATDKPGRDAHSIKIMSPKRLYDDASGRFEILVTNADDDDTTTCHGYYEHPRLGCFGCGDRFDLNDGYQRLIDEIHAASGTCDRCHRYFGADALHGVAFANKACDGCVDALRAKLETPGWCD